MKIRFKFYYFILVLSSFTLIMFGLNPLKASQLSSREQIINEIVTVGNSQATAPVPFLLGIARVESNFQRVERSNLGDVGIFQFDRKLLGKQINLSNTSLHEEIRYSVTLINKLYQKYEGNKFLVLLELKSSGRVGGWPNSRVVEQNSSYITNVLEAEKIFETMLYGLGSSTPNDNSFYMQLSQRTELRTVQLPGETYKSNWPDWKKELYFVSKLLNHKNLNNEQFKKSSKTDFASELKSSLDYIGSSKMNFNEDDF